ncbi:MAG: S8 family serine peptidase, partial [Gemmatimonadetes bacterium]|nr:S8 family serine peptidase [Gemmatimonadota bacterium]
GYDWDHPALIETYRGTQFGSPVDHNYNWHDAITGAGNGGICVPDSPVPCDDHGHGTHTAGTMVGDDFGANQIGVAPGAEWIGCRCMDQGDGTPGTYADCLQWMIAPTDLAGSNPDPARAPDVLNNSWSCPASEGCTDINVLKTVVENVRAAGIVVVVSAGNEGPGCETVARPIAIYDGSFSIGATDINDDIAGFSSRGAVSVDGSGRAKPDMSAPGVNVRSSIPGGSYSSSSGTSMAAPHVAGAVALLVSANPGLRGDVDAIESILTATSVPKTSGETCSGVPGSSVPNHTFGHGILDVYAAYLDALNQAVGVDGAETVPARSTVRNEPNPFNPATAIHFTLPAAGAVTMTVYDVRGRAIRSLLAGESLGAGPQTVRWDGTIDAETEAPSGVYFYRIEAGAFRATGRMNLVR